MRKHSIIIQTISICVRLDYGLESVKTKQER